MEFRLTRFAAPARWATRGSFEALDPAALEAVCRSPELWPGGASIAEGEDRLPAWSFARFRDDSRFASKDEVVADRETRERVEEVGGLAIEYVDEPLVDAEHISRWWGDHGFVAYTTAFHNRVLPGKPEGPRWRVLIPFDGPVDRDTAELMARWAMHGRHHAGNVGEATLRTWRPLPLPALAPGDFEWHSHGGPAIDTSAATAELARWEQQERALDAREALEDTTLDAARELLMRRLREPQRQGRVAWQQGAPRRRGGELEDTGLPNWSELDSLLGPLSPGKLALMVGPTGHGRSSFALQLAQQAAAQGHPVMVLVVGVGPDEIMARLIAQRHEGGSWADIVDGAHRTDAVDSAARQVIEACPSLHLWSPPTELRTAPELIKRARSLVELTEGRPPCIIVDTVEGWASGASANQGLRLLSGTLCDIVHPGSLDSGWPGASALVIRGATDDEAALLRDPNQEARVGAGILEQDASLVLGLHVDRTAASPHPGRIEVWKNRHGLRGSLPMVFDGERGCWLVA